jgi:hypothetical protein
MQVEAVHQLAVTLRTSPRLFACLLGSGVSRSAGVPTGWEVLLDLVRRHAALEGRREEAEADPAQWFSRRYGHEPDYSDVVQALAPTSALRRNLLEEYFTVLDAVTHERREHEPTPAHRSIARLVQRGLLRVIVTTNFDRLMELALREAGVARIEVVSLQEAAGNCYPFHASEAFVFKVHGDWRDLELRNSRDELERYPEPIAALLRRILDEHGLIVCGWSAEYDRALREALQAYHRRFPVYWVDPNLREHASQLCDSLRATPLAANADSFFGELEAAVLALERSGPPARLRGDVLVLRARRAVEMNRDLELETLLSDATRELVAWIGARQDTRPESEAAQAAQLEAAERASEPLCRLVAALAHYGIQPRRVSESLSRLLAAAQERLGLDWVDPVAVYPAVLFGFTWGVGCAARDDWRAAILGVRAAGSGVRGAELRFPPGSNIHLARFGGEGKHSPPAVWGEHVADTVYQFSEEWIARRNEFDDIYDRFDVLVAVRSLLLKESWIPRCFVESDVAGKFSRFELIFEDWFKPAVDGFKEADPLSEAFDGIHVYNGMEALRRLAREQQAQWNPV